jgi:hypothetical protein
MKPVSPYLSIRPSGANGLYGANGWCPRCNLHITHWKAWVVGEMQLSLHARGRYCYHGYPLFRREEGPAQIDFDGVQK